MQLIKRVEGKKATVYSTPHYRVCVFYALALQVSTENLLVLDYVIVGECMMDVSS